MRTANLNHKIKHFMFFHPADSQSIPNKMNRHHNNHCQLQILNMNTIKRGIEHYLHNLTVLKTIQQKQLFQLLI